MGNHILGHWDHVPYAPTIGDSADLAVGADRSGADTAPRDDAQVSIAGLLARQERDTGGDQARPLEPDESLFRALIYSPSTSVGAIELHLQNAQKKLTRSRYPAALEASNRGIQAFRQLDKDSRAQHSALIVSLLMLRAETLLQLKHCDKAIRSLRLAQRLNRTG